MHEFSIVQNIIDIAVRTLEANDIDTISEVEVEVGTAAGVVLDALNFAWESAIRDTVLADTKLKIIEVPVEVRCTQCKTVYHPTDIMDVCPECGDFRPDLLKGRELRVSAIIS